MNPIAPPKAVCKKTVRWSALGLALLSFSAASCTVQPLVVGGGCTSDAQCKDGRVCADRICSYPDDLARRKAAQHIGEVLLRALAASEPRIFASVWPDNQDYAWAFDFSDVVGDPTGEALIAKRSQVLTDEFAALATSGRDWAHVSFTRFEPGASRPIVSGLEHAKQNLEQLQDSRLFFKEAGSDIEQSLTISSLLMMRGRWRLFRLIPPAMLPDGDSDKR